MKSNRVGAMLILHGLILFGIPVRAQDCVPSFFNTEHRDSEWFYGVGKGSDAGEARKDALRQLYLKISGGGVTAPAEALAGWEQNEYGECQGNHYVGVRIEMARVKRNRAELKSQPQPIQNTLQSLPGVLAKVEKLGNHQQQSQQQVQLQSQSVIIHTADSTPIVVIAAILGMVLAFLAFVWAQSRDTSSNANDQIFDQNRSAPQEPRLVQSSTLGSIPSATNSPRSASQAVQKEMPEDSAPLHDELTDKARAWVAKEGGIICPSHKKPMGNSGERGQRWAAIVGHLQGNLPKGHGMKENGEPTPFAKQLANRILEIAEGAP